MHEKILEMLRSINRRLENSPKVKTALAILLSILLAATGIYSQSPYIKAITILVLSLVAARFIDARIDQSIRKLSENSLVDQMIGILHRPIFWSVILLGVLVAVMVAQAPEKVVQISQSAVFSALAFLWMLFALSASKLFLETISRRGDIVSLIRSQTLPLFINLAAVIIIALGIYFIFQAWHVDMTAWLASAGIAGIAIGFAAKDTLANLFSGVFIMADAPYTIGDYVVIDNTVRGEITHIGIRSTRLLTRDDVEVTIPNSVMGNSKVINESGGPHEKFRIRVKISIAYGSDLDQVNDILISIATTEPEICTTPEPRVRFRNFGPSGLEIELLGWVDKPEFRGRVMHALNSSIYKRFMAEGIEIPYSKQDIYIKEIPGESANPGNS